MYFLPLKVDLTTGVISFYSFIQLIYPIRTVFDKINMDKDYFFMNLFDMNMNKIFSVKLIAKGMNKCHFAPVYYIR
jgi:hypothetical protein